jgi:hypothetical protein
MGSTYFEKLQRAEWRFAEWQMLGAAMRERRAHAFRRSLLVAAFWVLGAR